VSLQDKAMLVSLNIAVWNGRKFDKEVSDEVCTTHDADLGIGRFTKMLLDPDALKPVQRVAAQARQDNYKFTSPWGQDGSRILPSAMYFKYMEMVRTVRPQFEDAVRVFIGEYPRLVIEAQRSARHTLGKLYKAMDYPTQSQIERKFGFDVAVFPLPNSDDFRITLSGVETDRIKADIERRILHAQHLAMQDVWNRLHDSVSGMIEKLEGYTGERKGAFRDSLIENIRELVDILPGLNITNDPHLDTSISTIKERLTGFDADTLRGVPYLRNKVVADAKAILENMAGYLGENQVA
jgi:hypothetical protein